MTQKYSRRGRPWRERVALVIVGALAVSAFSSGCAERDGAAEKNPASASAQPTSRDLYLDHCGSCHGADGRGDGPRAAELEVTPINLRVLKQDNDGMFPTLRVQRSIDGRAMARAHGLPDMPVWSRRWMREGLSEADVQARTIAIASYIASIQD